MMVTRQSFIEMMYQSIAETLSLVLDMPSAIWLLNDEDEMTIRASSGLSEEYIRKARLSLGEDTVATRVFHTREAVFVSEVQAEPSWKYKDQARQIGVKSAWVLPLCIRKKMIGVLDVYNLEQRDFNTREKQIIACFVEQTALAVSYFEGFKLLSDVSVLVNRSLYQEELFDEIMKAAQNVLDCEHVSLFLATHDNRLLLKSSSSQQIARTEYAFGSGLAGWVADEKRPALVDDVLNDDRFVSGLSEAPTDRSMLLVPILQERIEEDQLIGVISADKHGKAQFNDQDILLMEAFARQAAVALENADLLQQIQDRATAIKSLHEAGANLLFLSNEPGALEAILLDTAKKARQVLDADIIHIYRYNQDGNHFTLPPVQDGDICDHTVVKREILEDDILYKIIQQSKPVYTCNAKENETLTQPFTIERDEKPVARFVVREEIESSAALPLIAGGEHVGVMFANFRMPQTFSPQQRELIELFAHQVAIAIHNVRVYQFERTVNDIGRELTSKIDLKEDDVLALIRKKAGLVMDVDNMFIALYDKVTDVVRFGLAYVNGEQKDTENDDGWQPRKAGKGKTEEIIRTREPLFHPTQAESEKWYEEEGIEYVGDAWSSWVGVPIILGVNVLGVVATYHPEKDYRYSYDDLEILKAIANQAAIALTNVELYDDVQRREKDAKSREKALIEMARVINEGVLKGEQRIFEAIHKKAKLVMNVDNMYIALYDEANDVVSFSLAYVGGIQIVIEKEKNWQPRKAGKGKTEEIIRTRKSLFHPTNEESSKWYEDRKIKPRVTPVLGSWVGVPILSGKKVFGVIATFDPEHDSVYSEDDLKLLEAMANQAAVAIENARMYHYLNQELQQTQQRIVAAERLTAVNLMSSEFAHRLNNLTGTIPVRVDMARAQLDPGNARDRSIIRYLEGIKTDVQRLFGAINDLEKGSAILHLELVNLNDMVNTTLTNMYIPSLIRKEVDLGKNLPNVKVSVDHLSETLNNLVVNAVDAMPDGGELKLKTRRYVKKRQVILEVSDTGMGLSEIEKKNIFKLFYTTKPQGLGFGLWRDQNLIEQLGGSLEVGGQPGEGATFTLTLPEA